MYKDLPKEIIRRCSPEELDHSFNLILGMSEPIYYYICDLFPPNERWDEYLNRMIHQLVLRNLNYIWNNEFEYSLMYKLFYNSLSDHYRDELILQFKKHERDQWRRPYQ